MANTRNREGGTVSPQESMTDPYEPNSRATDTGSPTVDQYAAGCRARR
ncbi:hypothetical protein GCM10012287_50500 [Streptomyces daqingensis]|uniref:Uncharacterized protein n=1 Tax=Streptomyces daqingensis TaxID=1472640 RepID=A0ABQ2MRL5_9ACTN|nr:hypothetical protein GCM10012287_50500 [Streptomyces daqingensis]